MDVAKQMVAHESVEIKKEQINKDCLTLQEDLHENQQTKLTYETKKTHYQKYFAKLEE